MPQPQSLLAPLFFHCQLTATPRRESSSCSLSVGLSLTHIAASMLGINLKKGQPKKINYLKLVFNSLCCDYTVLYVRINTFIVMPHSYFPNIAQTGVCCNVKNIKSIACEGSPAIKMAMPTAAFTPIQTDTYMGCGACEKQM